MKSRFFLPCILVILCFNFLSAKTIKVGVLTYGTVNWTLETIKNYTIDKKFNYQLEIVKLGSKSAQLIALHSGDVDIIVNDWIWVNHQKKVGNDYLFYPYSKSTGSLMLHKTIQNIEQLKDLKLGIALNQYNKTWLLLKNYFAKKYNLQIENYAKPTYLSPPILFQQLKENSLKGGINFWHFNAKLPQDNFYQFISVKEALHHLGVQRDISFLGWVFKEEYSIKNQALIQSFLDSVYQSRMLLFNDPKSWQMLAKFIKLTDKKKLAKTKEEFHRGVISSFNQQDVKSFKKVFDILQNGSNLKYLQNGAIFHRDIFWLNDGQN